MTKSTYLFFAIVVTVVVAALIWWPSSSSTIVDPTTGAAKSNLASLETSPGTASIPVQGTPSAIATSSPLAAITSQSADVAAANPASAVTTTGNSAGVGVTTVGKASTAPPSVQQGMIDLDKTQRMIRDYRTLMGENPVGTNAEIMKAVMGGNPRQATVGPGEGQQLNAKGELIDQWGTPYFFHQLSGDHMEIHSAGPDKIMGTDDDLILK